MKWTANQNELTVWQTQRSRVIALLFLPVSYGAPFPSCNQRLVWKSNRMPSWGSTASDKADWMNVLSHDQRNTHCLPKCTPPPIFYLLPLWRECLSAPQFHGYEWSRCSAVKVVPPQGARTLLISAENFSEEWSLASKSTRRGVCSVTGRLLINQSDHTRWIKGFIILNIVIALCLCTESKIIVGGGFKS